MSQTVLITGGSGLVGRRLTELLTQKGYQVTWLTRSPSKPGQFRWNPSAGEIDQQAVSQADFIIHLAGANVGEGRWTDQARREIRASRVESTRLLAQALQQHNRVKALISASAIGIYPDKGGEWLTEDGPHDTGFLASVCEEWEREVQAITQVRTAIIRIGIVLSEKGGALPKIALPVRLMAGAALGSGKQYMSWIHLDDLCRIFIHAMETPGMSGPYNAAAPEPVTNAEMTRQIAKVLHRPLFLPNVPAFALKLMMGEMSEIALGGCRVSAKKLLSTGFQFQFPDLEPALKELLGK